MTVYQKFKQIGKLESFFKIYFPSILGLILTSVSSSGYGALGFTGLIGFTQASVRAFGRTRNNSGNTLVLVSIAMLCGLKK